MTRSLSIIVFNRWAIVKTVQSLNLSRMVSWINESVLMNKKNIGFKILAGNLGKRCWNNFWSTLAVASSNTRILFLRSMARARQASCLWPTDKLVPPSVMTESSPADRSAMDSFNLTASKALQRRSSLYSPKGSKFLRNEPEKRTGSCGMMEILERRSCSPMLLVSIPSMKILPSGSVSRKREAIKDDLPAPVLPTIPI